MAQKKTIAAKSARKTIKIPAKIPTPTKIPAKVPTRHAAPLLEVAEAVKAEAVKVVEKPAATAAKAPPRLAPSAPTPSAPTPSVPSPSASNKDFGDLAAVGRENLEACVKCGTIAAKGAEALGTEVMSFTQANIEADLAAAKEIMAAKTLYEAIDLQTSFVQARLERMTNETTKLGELSWRLANLTMEPLRSRFDASTRANTWANTWTVFRPLGF